MAQAYEELAKGDLAQASKMGWEAAEQMVKAVADERGWGHASDRDIYHAIELLESDTGDSELVNLFGASIYLYLDFYEDTYSADFIKDCLGQIEEFVIRVEDLLNHFPKPMQSR